VKWRQKARRIWRSGDFSRFRGRSSADRRLLIEAGLWLAVSRAAILVLPFRWTARLFSLTRGTAPGEVSPGMRDAAHHIGLAVRSASTRTPWQSACLAQSLAGVAMLRRRQIPAIVAMGVAKDGAVDTFTAHAWLSCGGVILTGAAGHERYRVMIHFILH
jgi:hypothetical protein